MFKEISRTAIIQPEHKTSLQKYSFFGAVIVIPFIAWMMFRPNDISRLEPIAILVPIISTVQALMVAAFEMSKVR